jgi:hypothetical protein
MTHKFPFKKCLHLKFALMQNITIRLNCIQQIFGLGRYIHSCTTVKTRVESWCKKYGQHSIEREKQH